MYKNSENTNNDQVREQICNKHDPSLQSTSKGIIKEHADYISSESDMQVDEAEADKDVDWTLLNDETEEILTCKQSKEDERSYVEKLRKAEIDRARGKEEARRRMLINQNTKELPQSSENLKTKEQAPNSSSLKPETGALN